ncbi:MAG TPA: prepilin-type N-terminal cleavage/methylation domain-containing protein [Tepidisphaeraceae bacterium]|jgi:general secretion pathway protein G|nr:prepilin-type N-terminal cleavage/methylation domain-containing protein [Tepidisphaeraceae bacterium]
MKSYRNSNRKGFTLVEILIVVIILGILAAIVIPQFTNASSDARQSSMTSQLQTIRSQLELYKMQHGDLYPTTDGKSTAATFTNWDRLTGKTDADGTIDATGAFGPYLQQAPVNPLTSSSTVSGTAGATVGYVFEDATGKIYGVTKTGTEDTAD